MNNKAIIIDLDGTLINNNARALSSYIPVPSNVKDMAAYWEPFFKESVFDDPNLWCMEIVEAMSKSGYKIIFLTGRSATDSAVEATQRWIEANVDKSIDHELIMRPMNDERRDSAVKRDIVTLQIMPKYFVLFAIDDKRSNVDMFESLSIPCLHCADY